MQTPETATAPGRRSLVGRGRELEIAAAGLEDALAGRTGIFLVSGEPGIGKTRLVEEVAEIAAARSFQVLRGVCWEAGGAPPYWPWIQLLRPLGSGGDPMVSALLEARGPPRSAEQVLLFDAVVRRLAAAAQIAPLLVAIEDLHAADHGSLLMTEFVGGGLRGSRAVLVGTHRAGAAWLPDATQALLGRFARHGRTLSLARLGGAEVKELLLRTGEDAGRAADLHAITGGNPLFVHELINIGWHRATGDRPLPSSIIAVIGDHLGAVGAEVRELLEVAAVLGHECGVATLADMTGGAADAVALGMATAARAGLVVEPVPGRYAFSHGLVRETLRRSMSPGRIAELHRLAAESLQRIHAADPAAPLTEIAHHLLSAGPACADAAVDVAVLAARHAERIFAHEDAARLLGRALEALEVSAAGAATRRAEILLALASVQARAGSGDAGRATSLRAAGLARQLDHGSLLAGAALAYGTEIRPGIVDPTLVALLEEALARDPDPPLRAQVLARLAGALQPCVDPWRPISFGRQAIAQARALGDPELYLAVLRDAGSALAMLAPASERIEQNQELVRLALQLDRPELVLRGRIRLVFDHLERADEASGDVAAADEQVRACEALAAAIGRPQFTWPVVLLRAMRDLLEGRFADADRRLADAVSAAEAAHDGGAFHRCLIHHQLHTRRLRGDLDNIEPLLGDVSRAFGRDPVIDGMLALAVWPRAGAPERARADLERIFPPGPAPDMITLVTAAEACAALDLERARRAYEALLPASGAVAVWGPVAMYIDSPADAALMKLAIALGRWQDARHHAANALATARLLNARPHECWIRFDWGAALLLRGEPRDIDESRALLEDARDTATALGMSGLARRANDALAAHGLGRAAGELDATGPARAAPIELRCEGEVWALSGPGESCRLKDSRGMRLLAALLARPGREIHVLDLVAGGPVDGGDSGELLDARARRELASRLHALRAEIAEAEEWNDLGRAERARAEMETLTAELSRAVGLGGRARRGGAASERARVNVQKQLAGVIRRIRAAAPELGQTLAATIRTGVYCSYHPEEVRRPPSSATS